MALLVAVGTLAFSAAFSAAFSESGAGQEKSPEMIPVILDTDIGGDIDDALALVYAVKHPRIEVLGVTTVMGGSYRAPIALKLLELLGRQDVPVLRGARNRLLKGNQPMEGADRRPQMQALQSWPPPRGAVAAEFAPDWIARQVLAQPGKLTLVAYGQLTNIALALMREPRLKESVKQIVVMGGTLDRPQPEYNLRMDPEAARVVFESGLPITMVGLNVTMKCRMKPEQVEALANRNTPVLKLLSVLLHAWQKGDRQQMPVLHDPLAVGVVADRSLVQLKRMLIELETQGEFTAGATVPRRDSPEELAQHGIQVAVEVDADRFLGHFLETLLNK